MLFRSAIGQARTGFEARFEPLGEDWLFRARPTSVPVRVSSEERTAATKRYLRGIRWLSWGMLVGIFAACTLFVLLVDEASPDAGLGIYGTVALVVGAYCFGWWRLWTVPERSFSRRAPAGVARGREEVRRRHFAQLGWVQLLGSAGMLLLMAVLHILDAAPGSRERWFWIVAVGFGLAFVALQVWRKWRLGRELR